MPLSTPRRLIDLIRSVVRSLIIICMLSYSLLITLDVLLYHFGDRLPIYSPEQKDLLYSFGVFANYRHPDYRPWLYGFVNHPGATEMTTPVGDAARAYGILQDNPPISSQYPVDALGWTNDKQLQQARALFIGDSFCYGVCPADDSIYRLYEKKTGIPDFAACKGGYGLAHYVRLLDVLTSGIMGPENTFSGKSVFILIYMGNDLSVDIDVVRQRQLEEAIGPARHLWIESTRNLFTYLKIFWTFHDKSSDAATDVSDPQSAQSAVPTFGYYPVYLAPPGPEIPFAFHPFYRSMLSMDWLTPQKQSEIAALFSQMADIAKTRGLDVRVVVIPTSLQTLYPHIDQTRLDKDSPFSKEAPIVVKNFNQLSAFTVSAAEEAGLPVLDLVPVLVARPDAGDLYWPMDTHLTPHGNAVVSDAVVQAFSGR